MPDFTPTPEKCEKAFRLYIEAQDEDALADYDIRPSMSREDYPIPGIVFAVASDEKVKERKFPRGVFEIPLDIYIGTDAEVDPQGTAHTAAAGIIIAHLNDKRALRLALNRPAPPLEDDREVQDFHIFDYSLRSQPGKPIADGKWETVIQLLVIAQGMSQ